MTTSATEPAAAGKRQRGVRRTAWVMGVIALVIYACFIASGVFAWRGL